MLEQAIQKAEEYFDLQGLPAGMSYSDPAWREILLRWRLAASASMGKTDITLQEINALTTKDAKRAFTETWLYLNDSMGGALQALADLDFAKAALAIPRASAREALIAVYTFSSSGATLHWEGSFERAIAAGRLTEKEALVHLDRCIKVFEVIAKMGGCQNSGMPQYNNTCDPSENAIKFFGKAGLSGLGFTGLELGMLIVGGIVAIALTLGMVYLLSASIKQILAQEGALEQCELLLEAGKFEEHKTCIQNVLNASNEGMNNAFKGMNSIVTYAAVGLGIYAAIVFMPDIARSIRESRRPSTA